VFGLAFNTVEGFLVSGPNSRDVNCVPEKLEGSGYVEVTFPSLRLLPRTYDLHVSLYDYSCMHPFDFRQNVLRFDVERGPNHEQSGVAALGGKWRIGNLESEG
jgi:hypothetical protein